MDNVLAENYHRIATYRLGSVSGEKVYTLKKAYHRRNILVRIRKQFPDPKGLSVLEFGPGMGCLADLLHAAYPGLDYSAVDNNQGTLDEICARFPGTSAHRIDDFEQLAGIGRTFDVVAAIDVWEHLQADHLVPYTRWAYDALRPGGMLILQFPNWGCPLTASTFCSDLTHINQFNERTMQQLFALVGIPAEQYRLFNRRTPGILGVIRDVLMEIYCIHPRLLHVLFGTVRIKLFSPDLVVVVTKRENT